MLTKKLLLACVVLGCGKVAVAQDYFDFGQIPGVPDQAAIQLDLNPMLLGIAGAVTAADNPGAADLLSSIDGIRLRLYKTLEDIDNVVDFIEDVSDRLESADWERVVSVQDDSNIKVYIRADGDLITGVTAMIVGDEGAIFINVAGSISPEQLAQTIATFESEETLASLGIPGI